MTRENYINKDFRHGEHLPLDHHQRRRDPHPFTFFTALTYLTPLTYQLLYKYNIYY